jgi:hypothetical protein
MRRIKISFQKLVNFVSYDDEILFEVFGWMIQTGWNYQAKSKWGSSGVFECLYGLNTLGSQDYHQTYGFHNPKEWITDLKRAFLRALIPKDVDPVIAKWRDSEQIWLENFRYLNLKVRKQKHNGRMVNEMLHELFSDETRKKKLTTQLNSFYADAVDIHYVLITRSKTQWHAVLNYGFDHSSWCHTLASQSEKNFGDFLEDACCAMNELTKKNR